MVNFIVSRHLLFQGYSEKFCLSSDAARRSSAISAIIEAGATIALYSFLSRNLRFLCKTSPFFTKVYINREFLGAVTLLVLVCVP